MKKMVMLSLVIIMLIVLATTTMASTIPVGVTPGWSVDFSRDDLGAKPITYTVDYGLNKQLLLEVRYVDYIDPDYLDSNSEFRKSDTYLTIRYAILDNLAVTIDYQTSKENYMTVGARYKYSLNDKLDLVGKLNYGGDDYSPVIDCIAQAEYKLAKFCTVNLGYSGVNQTNMRNVVIDSTNNYVVGIEFYPNESVCPYFDCYGPIDGGPDKSYSGGVTISF